MPCPEAHATCTTPVAGWGNENVYRFAPPARPVAGTLLIFRSVELWMAGVPLSKMSKLISAGRPGARPY